MLGAVVILSVGLLGLISTSAWSAQTIRAGSWLTEAAAIAEGELAKFQAGGCGSSRNGERTQGPFALEWAALEPSAGSQLVTVVITRPSRRGPRTHTFSTTVVC